MIKNGFLQERLGDEEGGLLCSVGQTPVAAAWSVTPSLVRPGFWEIAEQGVILTDF